MCQKITQVEELEALGVIYPDELEVTSNEYPNIALKISLQSHQGKEVPAMFEVTLNLRLSADYPDVTPEIQLFGLKSTFSSERIKRVERVLHNVAQENIGMPMIFTIVSALQVSLFFNVLDYFLQYLRSSCREEIKKKKKSESTRVTPEVFTAWKKKFDVEIRAIHEVEGTKKLTGRQLFLRDSTLNLSDVALMQAAGNEIEFDESLFDEVGFIKILP
ncbi:unnamed protein product [Brugia pahangi]|uniref:RWD domain-containing protein n=1 Tax=Brugia pahangi TaxID=6280 RepID=A0A0N4SYK5_BRUPA|nr:unnamed protein product [Brugia pahangi]